MSVPRRRGRKAKKTILEEYGEEREKVLEKLGGSKAAPFPRDAVQEALVLDARDRAAAKKRALVEDVPPPPVFDPFEDNLVRAGVPYLSDEVVGPSSRRVRESAVAAMASRCDPRRTRRPPRHPPHLCGCRDPRSKPSDRRPGLA